MLFQFVLQIFLKYRVFFRVHHLLLPVEVEPLGEQVEDVLVVELEEGDLDLEAVVVEPALLLRLEDLH